MYFINLLITFRYYGRLGRYANGGNGKEESKEKSTN